MRDVGAGQGCHLGSPLTLWIPCRHWFRYGDVAVAMIVAVTVAIIHDYGPIIVAVTGSNIVRDGSAARPNSPGRSGKMKLQPRQGDSSGYGRPHIRATTSAVRCTRRSGPRLSSCEIPVDFAVAINGCPGPYAVRGGEYPEAIVDLLGPASCPERPLRSARFGRAAGSAPSRQGASVHSARFGPLGVVRGQGERNHGPSSLRRCPVPR